MGIELVRAELCCSGRNLLLSSHMVTHGHEEYHTMGDILSQYGAHCDGCFGIVVSVLHLRNVASVGSALPSLCRYSCHRWYLFSSFCTMAMLIISSLDKLLAVYICCELFNT